MYHKKAVSLAIASAVMLAAMVAPGISQALTLGTGAHATGQLANRTQPSVAPWPLAPLQVWPTPTNTLTLTQQLQSLEQQMHAAYGASDWALVLSLIEEIRVIDAAYKAVEIREIAYHAHIAYGWDLMLAGQCLEALDQFRLALLIKPEDEEANEGLDAVARYCEIPGPSATASATPNTSVTPPAGTVSYIVQLGDTLYSISKKFGVSITSIMAANGLSSDDIWAGQWLLIPSPQTTLTPTYGPSPTAPALTPAPIAHLVLPGETLCSLARRYHTNIWAIMAYNHLYTTTIFAHTILYIPTASQAGIATHIVQSGDTLYSLAQAYGSSVASIMAANGLRNFTIHVGQHLIVPIGPYTWYPTYPISDPCGGPPCGRTYVVKAGDTLSGIAYKFGVSIQALKAANGLVSDMIYAGTLLYIPC